MKTLKKLSVPILVVLFSLFHLNCKKEECAANPDCLYEKIEEIVLLNYAGKASITEYSFQNQNVFYIDPGENGGSDQAYDVINSNCDKIGQLKGIAGNTIINGEDFFKNAKLTKVIWER
ncbi:MAG TPA: hypothetical protein VK590_03585 [Saprospiraceae bacterium]|nr:hypothetical protein [Saprospiraceae bacterium]